MPDFVGVAIGENCVLNRSQPPLHQGTYPTDKALRILVHSLVFWKL